MTLLRLLADDLTGALDSAARFVPRFGPIAVRWTDDPAAPTLALDSASRDQDVQEAQRRVAALAPALADAEIAFKKLDSLLRGHAAAELAACLAGGVFNAVVIAPAFPAQGRITRHGRQLAHGSDVGVDLVARLAEYGIPVTLRRPGDDLPPGVSLWDAESDGELAAIAGMARGRVLWCGSAGLAGALGGAGPASAPVALGHMLALVGSDHPIAAAQLRQCGVRVALTGPDHVIEVGAAETAAALHVALPPGLSRADAAGQIATTFAGMLGRIARPDTLIVVGGETLRGVCVALAADSLVVEAELAPGIPLSRLGGGRWDGLRIVSKSGAFGDAGLLARLLNGAPA